MGAPDRVGQIRTDLAVFLRNLAKVDSFWFITNLKADHPFSLRNRLGLTLLDYHGLLIAANLADLDTNGVLKIKPKQWIAFFDESDFVKDGLGVETTKTKFDLRAFTADTKSNNNQRLTYHVIRVGVKHSTSPDKISDQKDEKGKLHLPPQVPLLRSMQRSLVRNSRRTIMDTIIDNEKLYDSLFDNNEQTEQASPNPKEQSTKERGTDSRPSKRQKSSPQLSMAQQSLFEDDDMQPLRDYLGKDFDPTDPATIAKIDKVFAACVSLKREGNVIKYKDKRSHEISLLHIPRSSTDRSFHEKKQWFDDAMELNSATKNGDGNPEDSGRRLVNHLCIYQLDAVKDVLNKRGIPLCKPMNTTQFASLVQSCGLNGAQTAQLTKHLRDHLGKGFCPTRSSIEKLCEGHGEIYVDSVQHNYDKEGGGKEETVHYSAVDVDKEVSIQLARQLQRRKISPKDVKGAHHLVGGDHGGDAMQFGVTTKVTLEDDTSFSFETQACEILCRTDSAELIEKTVLDRLTKGLKIMATKVLHIYEDMDGKTQCCYGHSPTEFRDIKSFTNLIPMYVTGDLAFFVMALGRESMSGHWCYLCKLCRSSYSKLSHEKGTMWTMEGSEGCGCRTNSVSWRKFEWDGHQEGDG